MRSSRFISTFGKSIEPYYLWLLKDLRYLLTLKKLEQRIVELKNLWKRELKLFNSILWLNLVVQPIAGRDKLFYRHPWKFYRVILYLVFEIPYVCINTLNKLLQLIAELLNLLQDGLKFLNSYFKATLCHIFWQCALKYWCSRDTENDINRGLLCFHWKIFWQSVKL